jgi:osmotically-inducible protein OsmY
MGTSMRAASWLTGAVLAAVLAMRAPARAREVVRQSDSRIKARVEEALKADETLSGSRIFVRSVKDGVVLLGGKAKTPTDDLRAMGDAARVPGVRAMSACRIPAVVLEPFRAIVLRLPDDG